MKTEDKKVRRKMSLACMNTLLSEGFTQSEIGKVCGISRQAVHQRIHGQSQTRKDATEKKRQESVERTLLIGLLFQSGWTFREIAKYTNLSMTTVNYHTRKHRGLSH